MLLIHARGGAGETNQGEYALWKEDNPSASFAGDNVAPHAVPSASEKANT